MEGQGHGQGRWLLGVGQQQWLLETPQMPACRELPQATLCGQAWRAADSALGHWGDNRLRRTEPAPIRRGLEQRPRLLCPLSPRRFRIKSSSIIFRSGFMLGLYMSVLSRMMAKARMKMVSGLWNCCTTSGLHMQYRWLWGTQRVLKAWPASPRPSTLRAVGPGRCPLSLWMVASPKPGPLPH